MKKTGIILVVIVTIVLGMIFFSRNKKNIPLPSELGIIELKPEVIIDPEEERDPHYLLHKPGEIKIDRDGNIYILDSGNHRIMVYDREMRFIRQIGRLGQGPGELIRPTDFDIDNAGNVYIISFWNRRISIFDRRGKFIKSINVNYSIPMEAHLAVDSRGMIYLNTIYTDSLIVVIDTNGKKVRTLGKPINSKIFPYDYNIVSLECDESDNLWVCFNNRPRIRKYGPDGNLIFNKRINSFQINRMLEEEKEKDKKRPHYYTYFTDIECCDNNIIYICGNDYIYEIDSDGNIVREYIHKPIYKDDEPIPLTIDWLVCYKETEKFLCIDNFGDYLFILHFCTFRSEHVPLDLNKKNSYLTLKQL